jgi:hypothetical protein
MERAARRPLLTVAALTTAGALALAPITVTPPDLHAAGISPLRISTQEVQLTDAWSDLFTDTVSSVVALGAVFLGADSNYPLPSPTIPLAPVITQLVLNQFIYAAQLLTGNGGQIPGEISTHLTAVVNITGQVLGSALPLLGEYLKLPVAAAQAAIEYVTTATNPLLALFEAPAVFLNLVLNNQYGLLGQVGPIGFPIIVRNVLATALYTTPPAITLPFKKAAAATSTPTSAAASKGAPSGTASSARSKPAVPLNSSRKTSAKTNKTPSAKAGANSGRGHSARG